MLQYVLVLAAAVFWPLLPAWLVAGAGAVLAYLAYKVWVHARPREGEPPFETGLVPWAGVAPDMGRFGAAHVLSCLRRRHGDVFAVYMAGRRHVFVLDPLSASTVFRNKGLEFGPVADGIMASVFGVPPHLAGAGGEALHRQYTKFLLGTASLEQHTRRMGDKLAEHLRAERPDGPGAGLFDFVYRVMFGAATEALFGDGAFTPAALDSFKAFDEQFPLMAAGLPAALAGPLTARAARARRALREVVDLARDPSRAASLPTEWMAERQRTLLGDEGVGEDAWAGFQTALFWAVHGNTVPAAFWAVAFVAAQPGLSAELRAEAREAAAPCGGRFEPEALARMPLMDSVVTETLRLCSDSMVLREAATDLTIAVTKDADLRGHSPEFRVRRGDLVCLYPQLAHVDPELFPRPYEFRPRRFVDAARPLKRGVPVPNAVMPFAGGRCPGRKFARNEMALLLCHLLRDHDVRLGARRDGASKAPLPDFDRSRVGLGIMHPVCDIDFELVPARG